MTVSKWDLLDQKQKEKEKQAQADIFEDEDIDGKWVVIVSSFQNLFCLLLNSIFIYLVPCKFHAHVVPVSGV